MHMCVGGCLFFSAGTDFDQTSTVVTLSSTDVHMCVGGCLFFSAGTDFDQTSTVVTLSSTEMEGCVSLSIMNDDVVEFEESFTVSLSLIDSSKVRISNDSATITIKDDDGMLILIVSMK